MASNETVAEAIVAVRKMIHDCPAIKGGLGELRYQLKANGAINIIEEAHDREIKALEWKIENYAKVVECKDREVKAKDEKIEELREKWGEALNIADSVEKCASIERQTEAMFKKNEVIAGLRKQIAELRECLKEAEALFIEQGYADRHGIIEKWRTALEGSDNEAE